jgi:hypothetical protein
MQKEGDDVVFKCGWRHEGISPDSRATSASHHPSHVSVGQAAFQGRRGANKFSTNSAIR